jgi:porphobilinogen synthase
MKTYPDMRLRRLRKSPEIREILTETRIRKEKLIMPMFIDENLSRPEEIKTMPGIFRYSEGTFIDKVKEYEEMGIRSVLLFGIPKSKDSRGSSSYDPKGIIQRSIKKIKDETGIVVFSDLCLCEYTDNGHCGLVVGDRIDNDSTLEIYARIAKSYAEAGTDGVAPSGMMDGQVGRIRRELDSSGFTDTLIMAYSSKFSSSLYSPFREAAYSAPSFGDRRTYQMNYANRNEAMREIEEDIEEGADIVMVKPALFYLDIVREARNRFQLPLAAYSVSAEYSMLMAASSMGFIDLAPTVIEANSAIFRAGADIVITYFAEFMVNKGLI